MSDPIIYSSTPEEINQMEGSHFKNDVELPDYSESEDEETIINEGRIEERRIKLRLRTNCNSTSSKDGSVMVMAIPERLMPAFREKYAKYDRLWRSQKLTVLYQEVKRTMRRSLEYYDEWEPAIVIFIAVTEYKVRTSVTVAIDHDDY